MFTSLSLLFVGYFRVCELSCFRLAALNGWPSDLSTWVRVCSLACGGRRDGVHAEAVTYC